jgi:hypothetical protein
MNIKSFSPLWVLLLAACATQAPPVDAPAAPVVASSARNLVEEMLAYHRNLKGVSQADLGKELLALNSAPAGAETEVRKAIVLELLGDTAKLTRVRVLLRSVLLMNGPDAVALQPLAEWMMTANSELRRATAFGDRQTQLLKEAQHRFDALNEKLEAMKRIEVSQPASPIEITPAK